ncbi:hypothetical protein RYX36_035051, partial [Vicia faba]
KFSVSIPDSLNNAKQTPSWNVGAGIYYHALSLFTSCTNFLHALFLFCFCDSGIGIVALGISEFCGSISEMLPDINMSKYYCYTSAKALLE